MMASWNKGKIWSEETKAKMRLAKIGKKLPSEHRKNIGNSLRGKKRLPETILKVANANRGKKRNLEQRKRISDAHKGVVHSIETRKKMSETHKGDKAPNWKGGITSEIRIIRGSLEYRLWRESVFKRDNWTCIWCLKRGGILNADHIKPFSLFPELRFAIDNGRTLCIECHKTTDTYGYKSKK